MSLHWVFSTADSHTLYKVHPNHKIPQRMAWVSPIFDAPFNYRVFIIKTKKFERFETLQQAKDWAQAVVLLTN